MRRIMTGQDYRRGRLPGVGMTLVEMLVSITVLTVMILAFSSIMVQSQRFISIAQASRRSHALAASIGRVVRRDLRRASQNGFLAIASDGTPLMVLTAAGISHSIVVAGPPEDTSGTGSLICYGECPNKATDRSDKVLWRPEYILVGGETATKDILNYSFADIQSNVYDTARSICQAVSQGRPSRIAVPPESLDDIDELWQVLAAGCSDLSITWTDGTVEEGGPDQYDLHWYGVDRDGGNVVIKRDPGPQDPNGPPDGFDYFKHWDHTNQAEWPKAIKIRFRITDKNLPKNAFGVRAFDYEVVCNIGQ
jgi:type II secretory pathway pseudopilin PulG